MHSDEQMEYWVDRMKEIAKDHSLSKEQKESDLDDLEEQIKDRLDDSTLNFEDEYIADVMGRLVDIRGLDSLPT
jgi:hypothetical protein